MGARTWKLLRRWTGVRALAMLALAAAVPTVGVGLTCLVALVPVGLASLIGGAPLGSTPVLLGAVIWLLTAVGVGIGTLRLGRAISRFRAPWGTVTVGRDGLRWRDVVGATRFVAWSEVRDVHIDVVPRAAVVAELAHGRTRRFEVLEVEELYRAMRDALRDWREREPEQEVAALRLERVDARAIREWIARANKLLASGSYRQEAVAPEALVHVASDPKAAAEQRLGAAFALSHAPEALRVRVRVAVEETACPELGEALEEAIDGTLRPRTVARVVKRTTGAQTQ